MDETTSQPDAWPAELRAASGSTSQQPIYVHTAPSSAIGWKLATMVLGVSTVVLAILLSGQLASPQPAPVAVSQTPVAESPTPAPSDSGPPISDVSQLVGSLGFAIMQNYTRETGWPASVTADDDGVVSTSDDIELGTIPEGYGVSYSISDDAASFTLTLVDADGESAIFGPAS